MIRSPRFCALLMSLLLLAACPVETREAEVAPDTVMVAPDTVMVAPPFDPAAEPAAAQTIDLRPAEGVNIAVQAVIIPIAAGTQVSVHVRGGPPNTPLTAHVLTGSCETPGPLVADLEPVLTDAGGLGSSRTPIDVPPRQVANGNHFVTLRREAPDGPLLACGEIPAHPLLDTAAGHARETQEPT